MGNSVSENRRAKMESGGRTVHEQLSCFEPRGSLVMDTRLFARSRDDSDSSRAAGWIAAGGWRSWITIAMLTVVIQAAGVCAAESPAAKMKVSASPAASFGGSLVEGVMEFQGRRFLLILQGVSGVPSSVGLVFELQRVREIVGPYKRTEDGWRNRFGVTIRFDPPLESPSGALRIKLASQIYPKVSTGQGGYSQ